MMWCHGQGITHTQSLAGSWCQSGAAQGFCFRDVLSLEFHSTERQRRDGQTRNTPGDGWRRLLSRGLCSLRAQMFWSFQIFRIRKERCCWLLCLRKTCVSWDSKGCQEIASLQQGVQAAASPVYYDCLEWTGHRVRFHLEWCTEC